MRSIKHNRIIWIIPTIVLLCGVWHLFVSTAPASAECRVEGSGSTEPNWLFCYPTPETYTLYDYSFYADYRLYPNNWPWKVGLRYNPRYDPLPYGASSADNYHYRENNEYGPVISSGTTWGQQPFAIDEYSCLEFAYQIDQGLIYQNGSHFMVYSINDWAGCWPKEVIGEDGYLVKAAELDPLLTSYNELRECGYVYLKGNVYAQKFLDPSSQDYIPKESRGCCRGTAFNLDEKGCLVDSHYIEHLVGRDAEGYCNPLYDRCEPDPRMGICEMSECLDKDDECEITVVSSKLYKEIGPIREFPCPIEPCQGLFGIPKFPPGCGITRIPILQPCCSYHEGLRLDLVLEDCEGNQTSTSIPLHFGGTDDGDLGPITTECQNMTIQTYLPLASVASLDAGTSDLQYTLTGEVIQETFPHIADDECVLEANLSEDYDVLICRCPDLTDGGFCVKKIAKQAMSMQSDPLMALGTPLLETEAASSAIFVQASGGGKSVLPVTQVCEIDAFGGIDTDELKELLDWACNEDHGEFSEGSNNCGTMHDAILDRLEIDHDNICKPDSGKCDHCILGASDIADQSCPAQ